MECSNVRECGVEGKRDKVGDMFERYVTMSKERSEIMFGKGKGRTSVVKAHERGKQAIEILMKNELWRCAKK